VEKSDPAAEATPPLDDWSLPPGCWDCPCPGAPVLGLPPVVLGPAALPGLDPGARLGEGGNNAEGVVSVMRERLSLRVSQICVGKKG
jgi:hypothetical protein